MKISDRITMYGEQSLSSEELLSAVLGSKVAQSIASRFDSLRLMGKATFAELISIPGIGRIKACVIRALFELCRRLASEELRKGAFLRSPEDIASMFQHRLRDLPREVFILVGLDGRNQVMCVRQISEGSPMSAAPSIYGILHIAVSQGAAGIACVHNHPSGNTTPSRDDKMFTNQLKQAAGLLDLKFIDHIIIGDGSFFSMVEAGLL